MTDTDDETKPRPEVTERILTELAALTKLAEAGAVVDLVLFFTHLDLKTQLIYVNCDVDDLRMAAENITEEADEREKEEDDEAAA